eukprot:scaffold1913_cov257-Pinguiococcus_pyrenoidosus.AAC.30
MLAEAAPSVTVVTTLPRGATLSLNRLVSGSAASLGASGVVSSSSAADAFGTSGVRRSTSEGSFAACATPPTKSCTCSATCSEACAAAAPIVGSSGAPTCGTGSTGTAGAAGASAAAFASWAPTDASSAGASAFEALSGSEGAGVSLSGEEAAVAP